MGSGRYSIVCLVARQCGVVLVDHLLRDPKVLVAGVFTHSRKPKSEDPARGEREEFPALQRLLKERGVPLRVIDDPGEAKRLEGLESFAPFDFLLSLSWRFVVPPACLKRSRFADINLHRGKLPEYAGAEPVRRMLEDGLKRATITAHLMDETIDTGEILAEDHLDMAVRPGESIAQAVERVKKELDPIYPFTAMKAMNKILARNGLRL